MITQIDHVATVKTVDLHCGGVHVRHNAKRDGKGYNVFPRIIAVGLTVAHGAEQEREVGVGGERRAGRERGTAGAFCDAAMVGVGNIGFALPGDIGKGGIDRGGKGFFLFSKETNHHNETL